MKRLGRPASTQDALDIVADGFQGDRQLYDSDPVTGERMPDKPTEEWYLDFWDLTYATAEDLMLFGARAGEAFGFVVAIDLSDEDAALHKATVDLPDENVAIIDLGFPDYMLPEDLANSRRATLRIYETIEGEEVPLPLIGK